MVSPAIMSFSAPAYWVVIGIVYCKAELAHGHQPPVGRMFVGLEFLLSGGDTRVVCLNFLIEASSEGVATMLLDAAAGDVG